MDSEKTLDPGLAGEGEALVTLGEALHSELPDGFDSIVLTVRGATTTLTQGPVAILGANGLRDSVPLGLSVTCALKRLRLATYRPGIGTWLSARFAVTSDGTIEAEDDYDSEPSWNHEVSPLTYRDDLEAFPREAEHTPDWLAEKLAETDSTQRTGDQDC